MKSCVTVIFFQVIPVNEYEAKMATIRRGYGYEGCVLYFLDDRNHVVGLVKKKTIWYILCRAIRDCSIPVSLLLKN
jgi:hypothetical protein